MKTLILEKMIMDNSAGIVSRLIFKEGEFQSWFILERPFLSNLTNVSAIPFGSYYTTFLKNGSQKFPYPHYQLEGVPNRTGILIHSGNKIENTEGCLLVGNSLQVNMNGSYSFWINDSRSALNRLVQMVPEDFILNIEER